MKDLIKVIKLNQKIKQFMPLNYIMYLNQAVDPKIGVRSFDNFFLTFKKVPQAKCTGNRLFEDNFNRNYKLINYWREGNDIELIKEDSQTDEDTIFLNNPTNQDTTVVLNPKELPE